MPVIISTSTARAKVVTVQLKVAMSTGAGVTTAQRIAVHHSSDRALESLARPFETPSFQSDFTPHQLSLSTTVRTNPNFGSLTSAWLVSWAAPQMTESSSDNPPIPIGHRSSVAQRSPTLTDPQLE
jgi:hypothetical protein